MKTDTIVMCVVALLLGMLLANMLKDVCGCKVVEGQSPQSRHMEILEEIGSMWLEHLDSRGSDGPVTSEELNNYMIHLFKKEGEDIIEFYKVAVNMIDDILDEHINGHRHSYILNKYKQSVKSHPTYEKIKNNKLHDIVINTNVVEGQQVGLSNKEAGALFGTQALLCSGSIWFPPAFGTCVGVAALDTVIITAASRGG